MLEKYISSDKGRTYYWINDKSSDFTLVFLPGLSADHRLFDSQIEQFSKQYSTLVWDAPSHGKSRPYKDFSYHNAAIELKSILDTEDIKKVVLIGQSAGGFVAQSFYKEYSYMVKGIMFIGSCPYDPSYYSKSDLFWLRQTKWMFNIFPNGVLQKSMALMCGKNKHARDNMLKMLSVYSKKELCNLLYIGFAGFIDELCKLDIKCPIYLLVGKYDRTGKVMFYNKMCHKKEGYPLYIIEKASHNANDDNPKEVNMLLERLLKSLDNLSF